MRPLDLSISIVSWNTRELLDQCLGSIYKTTHGIGFETIVVDNASSDSSVEMVLQRYPQVRVLQNEDNVGFSRANNQAYQASSGRFFLLLNPDTVVRDGTLAGLARFLDDHPMAGAVGPLVLNQDGSLQYSWAKFPTLWSEARGRLNRKIDGMQGWPTSIEEARGLQPFQADWIGGCCLMIRREAVRKIGLMDESLFMYCEETDWCLRLHKAGYDVWVEPSVEIVHYGGQSSAKAAGRAERHLIASKARYFRKHHGVGVSAILRILLECRRHARIAMLQTLSSRPRRT